MFYILINKRIILNLLFTYDLIKNIIKFNKI